jgi:hypothetical protein
MTHVTHVGLDKHLQEQPGDEEINALKQETANISSKNQENNQKITAQIDEKDSQSSQ